MDILNATNAIREKHQVYSTCIKKMLECRVFSGPYCPVFGLDKPGELMTKTIRTITTIYQHTIK